MKSVTNFFKSIFKLFKKNKSARTLLYLVILVVAGYLLYNSGVSAGKKQQLATDDKKIKAAAAFRNPFGFNGPNSQFGNFQNRKTIIGTITNVSNNSIEVKPKVGDSSKMKIDKDTIIYGLDRKVADYKVLKKDQTVFATSVINTDNSLTAQRIRVQK